MTPLADAFLKAKDHALGRSHGFKQAHDPETLDALARQAEAFGVGGDNPCKVEHNGGSFLAVWWKVGPWFAKLAMDSVTLTAAYYATSIRGETEMRNLDLADDAGWQSLANVLDSLGGTK